jgi:hypothetical protein
MLETYAAVVRAAELEWSAETPHLRADQPLRVLVTFLDKASEAAPDPERGRRMVAALERLAASRTLADILDAADWQQEVRQDRPLPTREP